jgi:citronellol/citronellal dehydrogenase
MSLKNKVIVISGGSRGIGEAIALRAAADGAKIAILAKTAEAHAKLPGTIFSVAEAIQKAGGEALPLQVDVREDERVQAAIAEIANKWGGIDIVVNNASAINLTNTENTPMKKFDLMLGVNVRATFALSQAALPFLRKAANPHILTLSPPLNMLAKWFKDHVAYTISKYGMSMCTLGMAEEFKADGIAVNSLWPKTTIATAAIAYNFPKEIMEQSRKPSIMADAAHAILTKNAKSFTGNFCIDETVLRDAGVTNFDDYALNKSGALFADLFV